jgi:hypothetical protein
MFGRKSIVNAGHAGNADIAGSADNAEKGSGDCPAKDYVFPNLKIRTKRLVHEGHKSQSP